MISKLLKLRFRNTILALLLILPLISNAQQSFCVGETPNELNAALSTGNIQWQSSTTSCTEGFTDIDGAIMAIYAPPALTETTYFRAISSSSGADCCGSQLTASLTDGISVYPNDLYSNDLIELYIDGNLVPLNYPYSALSSIEMDNMLADLAALAYTMTYSTGGNAPFDESLSLSMTIIGGDITGVEILDGYNIMITESGCCTTDCCATEAVNADLTDGIAIYPNDLYSNDLTELYIDGNLVPLNYPYDASSSTEMDNMLADLAALAYTMTYSIGGNAPFDESISLYMIIAEGNISDIVILDASNVVIGPSACCEANNSCNCDIVSTCFTIDVTPCCPEKRCLQATIIRN